jgi:hypothetical protein
MKEQVDKINSTLKIIKEIEEKYQIKKNLDVVEDLMYCGVAHSNIIETLSVDVQQYFSTPYKAAGKGCFWGNYFDRFLRAVGGMRWEQTLYILEISETTFLYCAFWPWGSNPTKTSIRIGLICFNKEDYKDFAKALKKSFR